MRISDWSSDVCSSDLLRHRLAELGEVEAAVDGGADLAFAPPGEELVHRRLHLSSITFTLVDRAPADILAPVEARHADILEQQQVDADLRDLAAGVANGDELAADGERAQRFVERSEEHTSELQSLMRISYADFCLKKKKTQNK